MKLDPTLDMNKYFEETDRPIVYELYGVVRWNGPTFDDYAYEVVVKNGDQWVRIDNERKRRANLKKIVDSEKVAQLVVYKKKS